MIATQTSPTKLILINKYGITEKKKAELDTLTLDVSDAQLEVDQFQAIVASVTDKVSVFQGLLSGAENNRSTALANKNLVNQLIQNTLDLENNSAIAYREMHRAESKTRELTRQVKSVIDKLIYSAEVINRMANFIVRKKALNPLISDELISMITVAGNDANKAVALTLIALKTSFTAQASNIESEAATALEYSQSMALYQLMTGNDKLIATASKDKAAVANSGSLKALFDNAYENAKNGYEHAHTAFQLASDELGNAQSKLNNAQIKLRSLQSGLAAGNAAALAS